MGPTGKLWAYLRHPLGQNLPIAHLRPSASETAEADAYLESAKALLREIGPPELYLKLCLQYTSVRDRWKKHPNDTASYLSQDAVDYKHHAQYLFSNVWTAATTYPPTLHENETPHDFARNGPMDNQDYLPPPAYEPQYYTQPPYAAYLPLHFLAQPRAAYNPGHVPPAPYLSTSPLPPLLSMEHSAQSLDRPRTSASYVSKTATPEKPRRNIKEAQTASKIVDPSPRYTPENRRRSSSLLHMPSPEWDALSSLVLSPRRRHRDFKSSPLRHTPATSSPRYTPPAPSPRHTPSASSSPHIPSNPSAPSPSSARVSARRKISSLRVRFQSPLAQIHVISPEASHASL